MFLYMYFSRVSYHDIVAEWSKAPDLGSGLSWRRFKSCRCHVFFLLYLYVASHGLCRFMGGVVWSISERVFACDDDDDDDDDDETHDDVQMSEI